MLQTLKVCFEESFSTLSSIVLLFLLLFLTDHFGKVFFFAKANMTLSYLILETFQAMKDKKFYINLKLPLNI